MSGPRIEGDRVTLPARSGEVVLAELRALIVALDEMPPDRMGGEVIGWLTALAEERVDALDKLLQGGGGRISM